MLIKDSSSLNMLQQIKTNGTVTKEDTDLNDG